MRPVGLAVDVSAGPLGATVVVAGELDLATAQTLVDRASAVFETASPGLLTVDVAELGFCDSVGISALIRLRQRCDEHGWRLRMVNTQPSVRRMLVDFTGLGEYLNVS